MATKKKLVSPYGLKHFEAKIQNSAPQKVFMSSNYSPDFVKIASKVLEEIPFVEIVDKTRPI